MGLKERSAQRRKRIVGHVAHSHEEAEAWDLDFWQSMSPQERLGIAAAMSKAVAKELRRQRREAK